MKQIDMYTDGACLFNPGPMAWCAILRYNGHERVVTGQDGEPDGTNNRAELMAVIDGLRALTQPCSVTIYSDSQYVVKGYNEWNLPEKGTWGDCKNSDLWAILYDFMANTEHKLTFKWIRGHAGHPENEQCNRIAEGMLRSMEPIE
jgi:ribonuclease HI